MVAISKEWTDKQIKNYIAGIELSDYPRVFWLKMSKLLDGCHSLTDIGCGPGAFALEAARQKMAVQAVDADEKNLEALKRIALSNSYCNVTAILGNWLDVKADKTDVCVAAYCFGGEIGTKEGIKKILQSTLKIAFFIAPYSSGQKDFASKELYGVLEEEPPSFTGDYQDLLKIFRELGETVQHEILEYDFGMPIKDNSEDSLNNCALYLCEKLGLCGDHGTLEAVKRHVKGIVTVRNGVNWVPNPRKSVMITWRRQGNE